MKGFFAGVASTLVVAIIGAYLVVRSGLIPANADAQPGRLETWVATTSLDTTLLNQNTKGENPVALTDQHLLDGVHLFGQYCSVRHGSEKGDASASPIAKGLYQKPPQFATDGVEEDPEGDSFWKITHGLRLTGMPSFGHTLSDPQRWTLALFLKHMDKLPPNVQMEWEKVQNWPVASAPAAAGQNVTP